MFKINVNLSSVKIFQVLKEAKDSITKILVIGNQILTGSLDCFLRTYDIRMGNLDADFIGSKYWVTLVVINITFILFYYMGWTLLKI